MIHGLTVWIFTPLALIKIGFAAGCDDLAYGITFVMPKCTITLLNVTSCTITLIFPFHF